MDIDHKFLFRVCKKNILQSAVHPHVGCISTDGESVYLIHHAAPSMQNTKTLGQFRDVVDCSWSPYASEQGEWYLAVQQKTCIVIWKVTAKTECVSTGTLFGDLDFQKVHTIVQPDNVRGCLWHPTALLLLAFNQCEAILYTVETGETRVLHQGLNLTAGSWTLDGQVLVLADNQQLMIFEMGNDFQIIRDSLPSDPLQSNIVDGSVCSMTPISNHVVAIATELPLQKIVKELSADLFSHEPIDGDHNEHSILEKGIGGFHAHGSNESSASLAQRDTRDPMPVSGTRTRDTSEEIQRSMESAKTDWSLAKHDAEDESSVENTCEGSAPARGQLSLKAVMERAVREKKGPIDMTEVLAQRIHGSKSGVESDVRQFNPKVESALIEEKGPIDITELLALRGTDGQSAVGRSVEMPFREQIQQCEGESGLGRGQDIVDLMALKPKEHAGIPPFRSAKQPGHSSALLVLYDVRSKMQVSSAPLPGIITPSLMLHCVHNETPLVIVGSSSRRQLLIYSYHMHDKSLRKLPNTIELGEDERPIGLCSLTGQKDKVLIAVARGQHSLGAALPLSSQGTKKLLLKTFNLQTIFQKETGVDTKSCGGNSPKQHLASTSSPDNSEHNGLPTLNLPGGGSLKIGNGFLGKRTSIEVLEDKRGECCHTGTDSKAAREKPSVQPNREGIIGYPTPETAETVSLRCERKGEICHKTFLLLSGMLRLQTIQHVFQLSQVEIQVGGRWIVLTSDREGFIPLNLLGASSSVYSIREAVL